MIRDQEGRLVRSDGTGWSGTQIRRLIPSQVRTALHPAPMVIERARQQALELISQIRLQVEACEECRADEQPIAM